MVAKVAGYLIFFHSSEFAGKFSKMNLKKGWFHMELNLCELILRCLLRRDSIYIRFEDSGYINLN